MTIKKITLLSKEEYKKYKQIIPLVKGWWWLRSPDNYYNSANIHCVNNLGEISNALIYDIFAIRPALKLALDICDNLFWYKPEKLIGTKIEYGKYTWTVLDTSFGELYVLCDNIITKRCFDSWSNEWETSELKQWLETEGLTFTGIEDAAF